jgi:class 3 adenylate cyclase/ribosomal protein S18 acetylase RimI-like enzyme
VGQTISDAERDAAALFETHAYVPSYTSWLLRIDMVEEPGEPSLPDGLTFHVYRPGEDDRGLFELIETAFSEWPDRESYTFENWVVHMVQRPEVRTEMQVQIAGGDRIVGAAVNYAYEGDEEGWIQQLAVDKAYRGRGLGRALLQESFRRFNGTGHRMCGLNTDARTGALGLYEHVGMRVRKSYTLDQAPLNVPRACSPQGLALRMTFVETPETRYAKTPDGVHIAYQAIGDGPIDVLWIHTMLGGLEIMWEHPRIRSMSEKVASFGRLIRHDMRATGLSDRHTPLPDLETQARDILTVLDAVGSHSVVLFSAANPVGPFFAAAYPRRTRALCYFDPGAREVRTDDYPWGMTVDEAARELIELEYTWGRDAHAGALISTVAPTMKGDRDLVRWYAKTSRHWVAPGDAVELVRRLNDTDIRDILPTINVPTACIVRRFEEGIDQAEHVTGLIPDAELIVLGGDEHWTAGGDQDELVDTIRDFVGMSRPAAPTDSRLRALLFTDIVNSTSTAARLGDDAWKEVLARHHQVVRDELARSDGVEEDTAGDGFFATFDGPARAIRCAQAIIEALKPLGVEIRAGLHTGEVQVIDGKPGGIAVHIGARVASRAGASEILVSQTVKDLVAGSRLEFEDAGEHELKGVPNRWHLYRVVGRA